MSFPKVAKVSLISLGSAEFRADGLTFTKLAGKTASYYQQNSGKIDIQSCISMVADKYNLSDSAGDYIFEAARAVTAEVPNENGDAFPKEELLRFDHRLGKAVYQTFILKPHHINHRADNPKTARGVVIDASYNDLSPALDDCPACGHRTAELDGRDKSGLNCVKCGTTVKDEFVELLLAIDSKKDPTFANGVKTGALDSLSMGCEAGFTDCSICDNRARTVSQFCSHIKSGNKKKMFKTASGEKMSFEKCGEVVFTEISRVDQPADPKALQREIFVASPMSMVAETEQLLKAAMASRHAQMDPKKPPESKDQVPGETSIGDYVKEYEEKNQRPMSSEEMGIKPELGGVPTTVASKTGKLLNSELDTLLSDVEENKVSETTMKFAKSYEDLEASITPQGNVRVFTPKGTIFMIAPVEKPTDSVGADRLATEVLTHIAEYGLVETVFKYHAVLTPKTAQVLDFHVEDFDGGREDGDKGSITDKVMVDHKDGRDKPEKNQVGEAHPDFDKKMREERDQGNSSLLEKHTPDHEEKYPDGIKHELSEEEHSDMEDGHKNKWKSTQDKVILDQSDKAADKKVKKAEVEPKEAAPVDDKVATPEEKEADVEPKEAAPLEAQMVPSGPGPLSAAPPAMAMCSIDECVGKPPHDEHMAAPAACECPCMCQPGMCNCQPDCPCEPCMKEKHSQMAPPMPAAPQAAPPPAAGGAPMAMGASIDPMVKEAAKKYTSRIERLYEARINKVKEDAESKVASAEKSVEEKVKVRLVRAMKLAAKRQALNLEFSPLKAKMADVLMSEMDLDQDYTYPGMDVGTASHIIEATTVDAFDEFVDNLVKRATELMAMPDDALKAIEADVKNLRPVAVSIPASTPRVASKQQVREAAVNGNLPVAPSPSTETISSDGSRDNIRSALGTTKIRRTSQMLNR